MSDQFAMASLLFGKSGGGGREGAIIRTTYGTAVGDSKNGSLTVRLDNGDEAEYTCYAVVKDGQRVMIQVCGSKAAVVGCAATSDSIAAATAYIGTLTAENITAETLKAANAYVTNLEAEGITAGSIKAANAFVVDLEAEGITAETLKADHAAIEDLDVGNLEATYAKISYLDANYTKTDELDANYAKIDFANINTAAISEAWVNDLFVQG